MTDQAAFSAENHTLGAKGAITLTTGYEIPLTAEDILDFETACGVQGAMLCGSALSSYGKITLASPNGAWLSGGERLGTRTLAGATVTLTLCAMADGQEHAVPCARFLVREIQSGEGEDTITMSGYDEMLTCLSVPFKDDMTYPQTLGTLAANILQKTGLPCEPLPACNADAVISAAPDWGEGCTLRRALGMVAGAMGCFALVTPQGSLCLKTAWQTPARTASAGDCFSMSISCADFAMNRLRVTDAAGNILADAAANAALPAAADNTLEISDNAIFAKGDADTMAQNILKSLSGMTLTPFEGELPADPTLQTGDCILLTDLRGNAHPSCILHRTLRIGQEGTLLIACDPDASGVSLPQALSGSGVLGGGLLGDGVITARNLSVGAVDAEHIAARSITADKIALGAITSESGVIGSLSADLITAGKLDTDRLIVGGTEFSIVRALNTLSQETAGQDTRLSGEVLAGGTVSPDKVTADFGTGIEISDNAAVLLLAGKLDGTNSHMELTQDAINMVGGDINIATDSLQIRGVTDGEERMSLDGEGLSALRVVVRERFSAPNAMLKCLADTAPWQGGVQASIDAIPKYLTCKTTLRIPAGSYAEDVTISGFCGEELVLLFESGVYLHGALKVQNSGSVTLTAENLGDGCIYPADNSSPLSAVCVQQLTVRNLYLSGSHARTQSGGGSAYCVQAQGCNSDLSGCGLEYSDTACLHVLGGTACLRDCLGGSTGSNPATNANLGTAALGARGAHIAISGTVPMTSGGACGEDSQASYCTGSIGAETAGGMSLPGGTQVTRTFAPSFHCSYSGTSRKAYPDNKLIWQGVYKTYRRGYNDFNTGTLWFDEAAQALQGKTVRQATLTIRRANGGSSDARNVYLGTVKLLQSDWQTTYRPEFVAPETLPAYPAGTLPRETEGTFDVTNLMAGVQQGFGIGVYEPCAAYSGSNSPHYTQFYGLGSDYVPVLTVTYE